jgi:hypothetical protein
MPITTKVLLVSCGACCSVRRFDGIWNNDVPKCGEYRELEPAPPGAPGSIPNVELVQPDVVAAEAKAAAVEAL